MDALEGAVVRNEFLDTRKLVAETKTILKANPAAVKKQQGFPLTPTEFGWLAFAASIAIMVVEMLTRRMFWLLDVVLMFAHGLAGCLILFVFLFLATTIGLPCVSYYPLVHNKFLKYHLLSNFIQYLDSLQYKKY